MESQTRIKSQTDIKEGFCYVLHFIDKKGEIKHYVGFTKNRANLHRRMNSYKIGQGSLWTRNATGIQLVRLFRHCDGNDEKRLKALGAKNLCPHCSPYLPTSVKAQASEGAVTIL